VRIWLVERKKAGAPDTKWSPLMQWPFTAKTEANRDAAARRRADPSKFWEYRVSGFDRIERKTAGLTIS
jgi:hypothetical protein